MNEDVTKTLSIPDHVLSRHVGGETVILDLSNGTYFGLDPVGARVWQLLNEGHLYDALIVTLLTEFEVEEIPLRDDVVRLLQELTAQNLLIVQS